MSAVSEASDTVPVGTIERFNQALRHLIRSAVQARVSRRQVEAHLKRRWLTASAGDLQALAKQLDEPDLAQAPIDFRNWQPHEDAVLVQFFPTAMTVQELQTRLPGRNITAIYSRARLLRVRRPKRATVLAPVAVATAAPVETTIAAATNEARTRCRGPSCWAQPARGKDGYCSLHAEMKRQGLIR